ncbi:MAG: 4-hydroxy-3-methylbut-2-enyl diphosphate reductase, partial [Oscillospiraceae bacterium]|nr:4-hydroxy-3-methylbut-2-enyl diphosphate reductase [Oscillospiraceae bacterium]
MGTEQIRLSGTAVNYDHITRIINERNHSQLDSQIRKVAVAKTAGFCFGVNRAVCLVYGLLKKGKRVCTLGPLIHNPQVVEDLAGRGVVCAQSAQDVPEGTVAVIRSHGVTKEESARLASRGIPVADATCPYVAKIHRAVEKAARGGRTVLIAGDENHPEVVGIRSYAGLCYVFNSARELEDLFENHPEWAQKPLAAAAQTTFNARKWENHSNFLKKVCTNLILFDTICNATSRRQQEAAELARKSDLMLVIGGRQSSNTCKLCDVCAETCKTVQLENSGELPREYIISAKRIGVTAGASTPAAIIKEVLNAMSELENFTLTENFGDSPGTLSISETEISEPGEVNAPEKTVSLKGTVPELILGDLESLLSPIAPKPESAPEPVVINTPEEQAAPPKKLFADMTFEEALEDSLNSLNTDQLVRGTVMAVTPTEIQVDIGRKHTGLVPADEYSYNPAEKISDLKPGD